MVLLIRPTHSDHELRCAFHCVRSQKVEEIEDEIAMREGQSPLSEKDQQRWMERHKLASKMFLEAATSSAKVDQNRLLAMTVSTLSSYARR